MSRLCKNGSITIWSMRLLEGLRLNEHINKKDIILVCSTDIYSSVKEKYPEFKTIIPFERKGFIWKNRITTIHSIFMWRHLSRTFAPDAILSTNPTSFMLLVKSPVITTIFHDLKDLKTYTGLSYWNVRFVFLVALLKSKRIIAISNFVKKDILRVYPFVSNRRIEVIYNSINIPKSNWKRKILPFDYILYVSTLLKYKNLLTLLKAFYAIKDKINYKLVIIGRESPYWRDILLPYIVENHMEDRIIHVAEHISDEALAAYYQGASLFVHPSLHEGFGYTPIEAAMFEIPVLTNKSTALYETTMGLLNYYEPADDSNALAEKIISVLQNPPSRIELHNIAERYKCQYDVIKQAEMIYKQSTPPIRVYKSLTYNKLYACCHGCEMYLSNILAV